ncbi:hypothetical protein [Lactiplantibacillus pentosus]
MLKLIKHRLATGLVLAAGMVGLLMGMPAVHAANKADEVKAAYIMDAQSGQVVYA